MFSQGLVNKEPVLPAPQPTDRNLFNFWRSSKLPDYIAKLICLLVLAGGLLLGAWVSRGRERRAQPIWTWALAFGVAWAWALARVGAWAWYGTWAQLSWPGLALLFCVAFPAGFMACVIAAITAGRGKKSGTLTERPLGKAKE